jgi:hypothetical protein
MKEPELKSAVFAHMLRRQIERGTATAFEELALGQTLSRVDYVVVNARLHGIELKSASDSLKRLDRQQQLYSPFFERMTLVADERHCDDALQMIPSWWELVEVRRNRLGHASFRKLQPGQLNPDVDASAVLTLLWPFEMLAELESVGQARGWRGKPAYILWDHFYATFSTVEIMAIVKRRLRARTYSSIGSQRM